MVSPKMPQSERKNKTIYSHKYLQYVLFIGVFNSFRAPATAPTP